MIRLVERLCCAALLMAATTPALQGASIVSAPFSFGFGWSPTDPLGNPDIRSWNTNETASTNTPIVQGLFSCTAAPFGENFSPTGVSFPDRVLTDRGGFSGRISPPFVVPVTAIYDGAAPPDVAAIPNYRLRLEISKISIWAGDHNSTEGSDGMMAWSETTSGHEATSPAVTVQMTNDFNEAQRYTQLVWDPVDYDVPLAALNDPITRTFDILNESSLRWADGLEVEGRVSLIYAVPEPASLALIVFFMGIAAFHSIRCLA